ncbi:MAG: peptidoglycan DD-metalloendopeptidase family protein [Cyanobacteria bacterium P01_H01_bin.121]
MKRHVLPVSILSSLLGLVPVMTVAQSVSPDVTSEPNPSAQPDLSAEPTLTPEPLPETSAPPAVTEAPLVIELERSALEKPARALSFDEIEARLEGEPAATAGTQRPNLDLDKPIRLPQLPQATYAAPAPGVVMSDRARGCQTTIGGSGSSFTSNCLAETGGYYPHTLTGGAPPSFLQGLPSIPSRPFSVGVSALPQTSYFNLGDYYNRTTRPTRLRGNGDRSSLHPLSVPSPISSQFGWRLHPIFQEWRMHTGTDLAAHWGTPVIAVLSGRVITADWLGGYGLTVVLEHPNQRQTLYAHLSEVFVQPGDRIQQGEALGRVGSTGNSTGPHLHFEMRHQTAQGWVAVDPAQSFDAFTLGLPAIPTGEPTLVATAQQPAKPITLLEYRMSQLMQALRTDPDAQDVVDDPDLPDHRSGRFAE